MPPTFEIQHIQEPARLLLTWIPSLSKGREHRTWRQVAEIHRGSDNVPVTLTYLENTPDFKEAVAQGFDGYPAFPLTSTVHEQGVMETLMKRLPPRTRGDFPQYLKMFNIPLQAELSDFALLGYSEARLPSDNFAVLLPLEDFQSPFEAVMEIAGFRHESQKRTDELELGMKVTLTPFPHPMDDQAVEVHFEGLKLGHLPRLHARALGGLIQQDRVKAHIVRLNGRPDHPVVRIFLTVV